jgi:hypothetical protein
MRFALQCYVDQELYEAVKTAAEAAHMSVSQWLKLAVIGVVEGQEETVFRDRIMSHLLFTSTALDGLLSVQADKELRTRIHAAHGKRLREYRERIAPAKRGA